uniref:Uncharacterized protein n=1 Tax=Yersinia enterocolitica TaxID=630 RepID=B0RKM0_YEREN|nr:hypothetical protein [Yersinia enterocolitica]
MVIDGEAFLFTSSAAFDIASSILFCGELNGLFSESLSVVDELPVVACLRAASCFSFMALCASQLKRSLMLFAFACLITPSTVLFASVSFSIWNSVWNVCALNISVSSIALAIVGMLSCLYSSLVTGKPFPILIRQCKSSRP